MNDEEKLATGICDAMEAICNTVSLPTHKTLEKTLYFSAGMTLLSLVSDLIGFYVFVSWQGCLVCTLFLIILLWVERRQNDALLRMYRTAKLSAQQAVRRAKSVSTSNGARRSKTAANRSKQQSRSGKQSGNKNTAK